MGKKVAASESKGQAKQENQEESKVVDASQENQMYESDLLKLKKEN